MPASLKEALPWTLSPLIVNAPMATNAGGLLAATVSLAGGLGLIGTLNNMARTRDELSLARATLAAHPSPPPLTPVLPLGVGFLLFITDLADAMEVVREFQPAVVWLFAARDGGEYVKWTEAVRGVAPRSAVWAQTGSVGAALTLARECKPDAICLQGADAGGHGLERGAGVVSLLPEAVDALRDAGYGGLPLLASGGVADGRGVAAAVCLGAQGAVLGTRFLSASEAVVEPVVRASVLEAVDGGQVTVRSRVFDQLRGPSVWPEGYDGRSLAVRSYREFEEGMGLEEVQRRYGEALKEEDKGLKTGMEGRAAIWAGTGVGLVRGVEGAGEIVESVRAEARRTLEEAARWLQSTK